MADPSQINIDSGDSLSSMKLFGDGMVAMARNEHHNPTGRMYFDIPNAEPEDERSSAGQSTCAQEEDSQYMSLKNCVIDVFQEDMADMLKSLNIQEITAKLEERKPPPVPPRKSKLAFEASVFRRQTSQGNEIEEEPNMLVVHNLDVNKVAFIKESTTYKDKMAKRLKTCRASINWENVEEDRVTVTEVKGSPRSSWTDVQNWREEAESAINGFFMGIMVRNITMMEATWNEAKDRNIMSTIQVPVDDTVKMLPSDELPGIILVGTVITVPKMADLILSVVKNIKDESDFRSPTQRSSLHEMATWELKYLQAIGFEKILADKYHGLKIQVDIDKRHIELSGNGTDVTKAKFDITDLLRGVECQKIAGISKYQLQAYTYNEFYDHIQDILAINHVEASFDVVSDELQVYGKSQSTREEASRIIQELVKMTHIKTDVLTQEAWQSVICSVSKEVTTLFYIDNVENVSRGVLVCISSYHDDIMSKLRHITQGNILQERRLKLERGVFLVLERRSSLAIGNIKMKHKVDVTFDHAACLIIVRGLAAQVRQAMEDLKTLSDNVDVVHCDIGRPGTMKFLQSLTGDCMLKQSEDEFNCIIDIQLEPSSADLEFSSLHTDQPFKAAVTISKGDICDQLVDVIVCSVNSDSNLLAGDVGRALVDGGGSIIKKQFHRQYSEGLEHGDVAVTTGGNLRCKSIFYCCIPDCGDQTDISEGYQETVKSCLGYADVSNYSSIAFPALGCGRRGYPPHLAAKAFLEAVKSYEESTNSGIKEIRVICDAEGDIYTAFVNERNNRIIGTSITEDVGDKVGVTAESDDTARTGVEIVVTVDELAQTKADVLVNSSNHALDLSSGAVSQSLVKVGGNTIQRECKKCYPRGIQPGKVAITEGGKLRCKKIYHCCLPSWANNPQAMKSLTHIIDTCLEMASQSGYETIAFPALGAGLMKYPVGKVAALFKDRVSVFSQQNPLSCLRAITFVLYHRDKDAIKIFNDLFGQDPLLHEQPFRAEQMQNEEFRVGGLRLTVKSSPLLDEKVDAIVVPTDNKLSLNDVARKQLISVCGHNLMTETQSAIIKTGAVITSARNLPSSHLMFVSTEHFQNNMENVIKKCLRKADKNNIKSLSIPYIGPATDSGTEIFLSAVVKAVNEYRTTLKELKEVNVLLPSPEELTVCVFKFRHEFQMQQRRSFIYDDVKLRPGAMTTVHRAKSERKMPIMLEGPQMRMLSTDRQRNLQCKTKISRILNENLKSISMVEPAIRILQPQNIDEIKTQCAELDVMVDIDLNNERVVFQGVKADALMAYNQTKEIIRKVEYMNQKRNQADHLWSSVQWYYFNFDGQKYPFSSMSNLCIEEEYQKGQAKLTIQFPECQVTLDLRNLHMDASPTQKLKIVREEPLRTEDIHMATGKVRFFQKFPSNDIKSLTKEFEDCTFLDDKIVLKGKSQGFKETVYKLKTCFLNVKEEMFDINKPLVYKYLTSRQAGEDLEKIEKKLKCTMQIDLGYYTSRDKEEESTRGKPEIQVTLVTGDLTQQEVDVLVSSVTNDLDLTSGGVSSALLRVGGRDLQFQCSTRYPDGLKVKDIAKTDGGKLKCREVYHCCVPDHIDDEKMTTFGNVIYKCLYEASESGYKSIAFPALGVGRLGFPPNQVANMMFYKIMMFTSYKPTLQDIRIVVPAQNTTTLKAFQAEHSLSLSNQEDVRDTSDSGDPGCPGIVKKGDVRIGNVKIHVKQGEISMDDSKAVVNFVTTATALNAGSAASDLLQACGKEVDMRCQLAVNALSKHGVTITTASNIPADFIVHVALDYFRGSLKEVIKACLKAASDRRLSSLAFPTFWTDSAGMSLNNDAKLFIKSLEDFEKKQTTLKDISVVISEETNCAIFLSQLEEILAKKSQNKKSRFSFKKLDYEPRSGGMISKKSFNLDEVYAKTVRNSDAEVTIYSESHESIVEAFNEVQALYKSRFLKKTLVFKNLVYLTSEKVALLKEKLDDVDVYASVTWSTGTVNVEGLADDVKELEDLLQKAT